MSNHAAEEIRNALEQISKGDWVIEKGDNYYNNFIKTVEGSLQSVVASRMMIGDAHFIANTPTWLRSLLEENERLKGDFEAAEISLKAEREENERITKERYYARLKAEEAWKELDGAETANESLRSELAAKDKVLEEARDTIRNMKEDYPGEMWTWLERRNWLEEADNQIKEIGSILSQYARSAIVPNE